MDIQVNRDGYTCVKVRVDEPTVELVGFGDLHIGASTYCEKRALEVRNYIKDNNCLWIGMGDFIENANKRSVGAGVYEQVMNPTEQDVYLKDFLEPIAGKCIGYLKGNHEERSFKDSGYDTACIVCHALKMPYCMWEYFGIIAGEGRAYTVYAVHSYSGSKTVGGDINTVERDYEKYLGSVDIIMKAHGHKQNFVPVDFFEIDAIANVVATRPRAIVLTGHFLERDKSYAAAKPLRGYPAGTIALRLNMTRGSNRKIYPVYL